MRLPQYAIWMYSTSALWRSRLRLEVGAYRSDARAKRDDVEICVVIDCSSVCVT